MPIVKHPSASVKPEIQLSFKVGSKLIFINSGKDVSLNSPLKFNLGALLKTINHLNN
jgi:hypothetical protein